MEKEKRAGGTVRSKRCAGSGARFLLVVALGVVALAAGSLLLPAPAAFGRDSRPPAVPPPSPTPEHDNAAPRRLTLPVPLIDPSFFSGFFAAAESPTPTPTPVPLSTPTPTPVPLSSTAPSGAPVRIVIEAVGMDQAVVPVGLDAQRIPIVPRHEVGWYELSAQPGAGDNVVLWGHVLRFADAPDTAAPFARLHEVGPGTHIRIETGQGGSYAYIVEEQIWATPDQVAYILPQGSERLTLVSCIGEHVIVNGSVEDMTHRLITIARPAGATE